MNESLGTREPSTVYRNMSFLLLGIMQLVNLSVCTALMLTILLHRTLRTVSNLLTINSSFAVFTYAVTLVAQLIVAVTLKDHDERLCKALSYSTSIGANAICYSYLATAISQFFFNVLYRHRYLLTFHVHWLIIALSWCISIILPLMLYLPDSLQYTSEMQMCALAFSTQWVIFVYMGTAIGIPYFAIIFIYQYIARYTRRVNIMPATTPASQSMSNRDLHVLKNILTLIGILGTAGLPSLVLVIWNAIVPDGAPVPLYLFCALTISFCTNIQITFLFMMNRRVRSVFWNRVQNACRYLITN